MVVQPMSAALSQWAPVKPLAQTQRQELPATMLVPPLAQRKLFWHSERSAAAAAAAALAFWRGRTIRVTGMTTAAAIARTRSTRRNVKTQRGMPQHRRPAFLAWPSDFEAVGDMGWTL